MKDPVMQFLVRTWVTIYGSNVGEENGVIFRGNGPHEPNFVHDIVRKQYLILYTVLTENNFVEFN